MLRVVIILTPSFCHNLNGKLMCHPLMRPPR